MRKIIPILITLLFLSACTSPDIQTSPSLTSTPLSESRTETPSPFPTISPVPTYTATSTLIPTPEPYIIEEGALLLWNVEGGNYLRLALPVGLAFERVEIKDNGIVMLYSQSEEIVWVKQAGADEGMVLTNGFAEVDGVVVEWTGSGFIGVSTPREINSLLNSINDPNASFTDRNIAEELDGSGVLTLENGVPVYHLGGSVEEMKWRRQEDGGWELQDFTSLLSEEEINKTITKFNNKEHMGRVETYAGDNGEDNHEYILSDAKVFGVRVYEGELQLIMVMGDGSKFLNLVPERLGFNEPRSTGAGKYSYEMWEWNAQKSQIDDLDVLRVLWLMNRPDDFYVQLALRSLSSMESAEFEDLIEVSLPDGSELWRAWESGLSTEVVDGDDGVLVAVFIDNSDKSHLN